MSNWVEMNLDVLVESTGDLDAIQLSLQTPCDELLNFTTKVFGVTEDLYAQTRDMVAFRPGRNLSLLEASEGKGRRFENAFKDRYWRLVWRHLHLVSGRFPNAVFLAGYCDPMLLYAGKFVVRGGNELCRVHDSHELAVEWALLDIFAPFRAEHREGRPVGTLWSQWLADVEEAVDKLKGLCGPNVHIRPEGGNG